jgi:hypothetical protein
MKTARWYLAAIAVALAVSGCFLVSGQILIDFDLGSFDVTTSTVTKEDVDLTTEEDYNDHKEDLKGLADVAVLGTVNNTGGTDIDVEVWMTATTTSYTTVNEVTTNGTKLWGPFHVAAGTSKAVDWDTSAKLFDSTGKDVLIADIKKDGQFTVYALSAAGTYEFDVDNGVLALVLDFGK